MEHWVDKIYDNYLLAVVDMIFGLWCGFVFTKKSKIKLNGSSTD